jgi:hypothetical protein
MTEPDIVVATGHRVLRYPSSVRAGFAHACADRRLAITGGAAGGDSEAAWGAHDAGVPFEIWFPNRYYTTIYDDAAGFDLQCAAAKVRYVVDRTIPHTGPWIDVTRAWRAHRWWVDNFTRNDAMVAVPESRLVVISHLDPRDLARPRAQGGPKSGTAHCVRSAIRHGHRRCLWVHDEPDPLVTDVELVAPPAPTLFDLAPTPEPHTRPAVGS